MFGSNVAPRKKIRQLRDWFCSRCGNRNRGERYTCAHCRPGRRS